MRLLVLNCGSSSVKFRLFDAPGYRDRNENGVLATVRSGEVKGIGQKAELRVEAGALKLKNRREAERYLVAALNNESLELNRYRIERFQLGGYCDLFLSSCYPGVRKPDEKMYRLALQLTQRSPDECLLIDDRKKNLEPAQRMGMRTIHYQDPRQLRQDLRRYGVIEGSHD
jgi:FMN phosphatase YigB (HAD superfamily)